MYETTIFRWSFTIMGKSANISGCFAAWSTLGLEFSLCLFLCVCVSLRAFDFFEPDHHEQFLYTPLQNKQRRRHREHFPRKTANETQKTFPKSFSSWRSWQKKHSQEVFFLKILTEGTFPRVFLLEDLDRNIRKSFVLEDLNRNIP